MSIILAYFVGRLKIKDVVFENLSHPHLFSEATLE